jgi:cyclophilin family peptidyl-prolyl cis-trans isomerase
VDLRPEEAPYAVWNFASLAVRGHYDGVSYHRVVPDFVVQAGDPRGDAWGGPGWEIPDEINQLPYEVGALGMALSGPDTGGSQWFIVLSPQPHLEGTYTVFGSVSYGQRNAAALSQGDTIRAVEIERLP